MKDNEKSDVNETRNFLQKVRFWIDRVLKYSLIGLILLIGSLILILFISDLFSSKSYIFHYEVPQFKSAIGFTENEIRNSLIDKVNEIYQKAGSLKGTESDVSGFDNPFQIEVVGVNTNYNSLLIYLKQKFGIEDGRITGFLMHEGRTYCYKTRINDELIDENCITVDSSALEYTAIDSVLTVQSMGIVRERDPYILSMYFYKSGNFKLALEYSKRAIAKQGDAEKFALGTVANSLRELGNYSESEKYYLRLIDKFQDFPHAYFQYALLLLRMDRESDAIDQLNFLIENFPDDKRMAIRQMLKITCQNGRSSDFNEWKAQYLDEFPRERRDEILQILRSDPATSDC